MAVFYTQPADLQTGSSPAYVWQQIGDTKPYASMQNYLLQLNLLRCFVWPCTLQVLPTGHGHTLPPLFFLDKRYWDRGEGNSRGRMGKPRAGHTITVPAAGSVSAEEEALLPTSGTNMVARGAASAAVRAKGAVSVQRLRKEFYTTQVSIVAHELVIPALVHMSTLCQAQRRKSGARTPKMDTLVQQPI